MNKEDKLLRLISKRIRELRKEKGFSQEGFSLEANLNRSYYSRIERGQQNFSMICLLKISIALDVEISELFPQKDRIKADVLFLLKNK